MIMTESGLYIPASEVAYIKNGYAILCSGAKIRLAGKYDQSLPYIKQIFLKAYSLNRGI